MFQASDFVSLSPAWALLLEASFCREFQTARSHLLSLHPYLLGKERVPSFFEVFLWQNFTQKFIFLCMSSLLCVFPVINVIFPFLDSCGSSWAQLLYKVVLRSYWTNPEGLWLLLMLACYKLSCWILLFSFRYFIDFPAAIEDPFKRAGSFLLLLCHFFFQITIKCYTLLNKDFSGGTCNKFQIISLTKIKIQFRLFPSKTLFRDFAILVNSLELIQYTLNVKNVKSIFLKYSSMAISGQIRLAHVNINPRLWSLKLYTIILISLVYKKKMD